MHDKLLDATLLVLAAIVVALTVAAALSLWFT